MKRQRPITLNALKKNRLIILLILIVVAFAWVCSRWWVQLMLIQGDSMLPSYHNMQLVALDKHSRDFAPGDVIAFRSEGLRAVLVKRIVAGPGDTAQILDGTLRVNGKTSAVYSAEVVFQYAGILEEPVALDEGEYIVIGDNIAESKDSRYETVGVVTLDSILGRIPGSMWLGRGAE